MFHLSPSERQDCRDHLAQGHDSGVEAAAFGIDPDKRAAYDAGVKRAAFLQQPFLAEKPKKGCRPHVAGLPARVRQDVPANLEAPDWSVSLACAIPF